MTAVKFSTSKNDSRLEAEVFLATVFLDCTVFNGHCNSQTNRGFIGVFYMGWFRGVYRCYTSNVM